MGSPQATVGMRASCLLSEAWSTPTGSFSAELTHAVGDRGRLGPPHRRGHLWAGEWDEEGWYFRKVRGSELSAFHCIALLGDAGRFS